MKTTSYNGGLLVFKPTGMGSAAVVAKVKHTIGKQHKVGHTGTLDRFAEGLMLLLIGGATSLSSCFIEKDKRYRATFQFGASTDTLDPTGNVTESKSTDERYRFLTEHGDKLNDEVARWIHETSQQPPLYSALKLQGERFSDRARRGDVVLPKRRNIKVYESKLIKLNIEQGVLTVELYVSSGTYIRSFAALLCERFLFPVHLAKLVRLTIGPYSIEDQRVWKPCSESKEISSSHLIKFDELADWHKVYINDDSLIQKISVGAFIPLPQDVFKHKNFLLLQQDASLLAWCSGDGERYFYRKVFISA